MDKWNVSVFLAKSVLSRIIALVYFLSIHFHARVGLTDLGAKFCEWRVQIQHARLNTGFKVMKVGEK